VIGYCFGGVLSLLVLGGPICPTTIIMLMLSALFLVHWVDGFSVSTIGYALPMHDVADAFRALQLDAATLKAQRAALRAASDTVDLARVDPCFVQSMLDDRHNRSHMLTTCDLRNHAPELRMQGNLRRNHIGKNEPTVLHDRSAGFIARSFYTENKH